MPRLSCAVCWLNHEVWRERCALHCVVCSALWTCSIVIAMSQCTFAAMPGLTITITIIITISTIIVINVITSIMMRHRSVYLSGAFPSRPLCRDPRDLLSWAQISSLNPNFLCFSSALFSFGHFNSIWTNTLYFSSSQVGWIWTLGEILCIGKIIWVVNVQQWEREREIEAQSILEKKKHLYNFWNMIDRLTGLFVKDEALEIWAWVTWSTPQGNMSRSKISWGILSGVWLMSPRQSVCWQS